MSSDQKKEVTISKRVVKYIYPMIKCSSCLPPKFPFIISSYLTKITIFPSFFSSHLIKLLFSVSHLTLFQLLYILFYLRPPSQCLSHFLPCLLFNIQFFPYLYILNFPYQAFHPFSHQIIYSFYYILDQSFPILVFSPLFIDINFRSFFLSSRLVQSS